jgi:hypothetical protein
MRNAARWAARVGLVVAVAGAICGLSACAKKDPAKGLQPSAGMPSGADAYKSKAGPDTSTKGAK